MNQKTIDLRKPRNLPALLPPQKQKEEEKQIHQPEKLSPEQKRETYAQWSAEEYRKVDYSQYWFVKIGAVATVLAILGIFAQSYFFVAFVALAFIVVVMYAKRPPQTLAFSIEKKGVRVGKKLYALADLKSFWISNTEDGESELSLETTHLLQPFVRMPLGGARREAVREALLRMLPEKEHEELFIDQIARKMGF